MSFISYSQNFEDVMLWRALKHVKHGFYIDIGAWSPDVDSVTKAFYEAGWHGINVEPNPEFYGLLVEKRTKDINLQFAVSDTSGEQEMTFLSDLGSGMSTLDSKIAQRHHDAGWQGSKQKVQVTTLTDIWKENVPSGQAVHFLKVDVEGLEEAVLRGNDWTCFRPWIIVVEATLPMVQIESHEAWESIILGNDYLFAYADGLNRFYVAQEHSELLAALRYPPNVFDDFVLARQIHLEARSEQAEARAQGFEAQSQLCRTELNNLYQSRSWWITGPLRKAFGKCRNLVNLSRSHVKSLVRVLIKIGRVFISRHPRFRAVLLNSKMLRLMAKWSVARFPGLKPIVRDLMGMESVKLNARTYDDLVSVRIMKAMSEVAVDRRNSDSVVFLQVPHE